VEPASILVASATFLAAEVGRKPADPLATVLWQRVKSALGRILNREPIAGDVTGATIRAAGNAEPPVLDALNAVRSMSTGLRRAEIAEKVLRGARILWVDDRPQNNLWERELLHSLGAVVVAAESTPSALECLRGEPFHVAISDIHRHDDPAGGIAGAGEIRAVAPDLPVVFYVQQLASVQSPDGAHGITNEPNELLHLVLDRLERARI
jgi:CheY-like chemotaxis protein